MAEMEKEGRPPENKRSRKPAHPVKREINEEMKVRICGGEEVVGGKEAGGVCRSGRGVGLVPSCLSALAEVVVVQRVLVCKTSLFG